MPVCNECKNALLEPDENHKVTCLFCGHQWQLTDDNKSIVLNIEIKDVTTTIDIDMLLKGL